jgi:hypothetical protein
MALGINFYSILTAYADKNRSPDIDVGLFIEFLEKYAARHAESQGEWAAWTKDTGRKVWSELSRLVEAKRCTIRSDDGGTHVFLFQFYAELVEQAYASIDNVADIPFPSEDSLRIVIPVEQLRSLRLEADLGSYLEHPQNSPFPIIKIVFPENAGEALALSTMIPRKLMEAAMLKVRNYLQRRGNKEYFQNKLVPQLQGKESQLKDMLNKALIRPLDCVSDIQQSGDFVFYFWAFFCNLVKNEIRKKKDLLVEEAAVLQAVCLLDFCNNYYKTLTVKLKEKELAIDELERHLGRAPFLYTMEEITRFVDNKGIPLLGQYSREELEAHLKAKTTESPSGALPDLLIIRGPEGEQWFVKKAKLLPLCARFLVEARPRIKKTVSRRWVKILKDYSREPAMDSDVEFEKLLTKYTAELFPTLSVILQDPKLLLVYTELEQIQAIQESSRLFKKGILIPMSVLLLVKRKDLLTDARILLPFWYTVPVLSGIIAFFVNLSKKRRQEKKPQDRKAPPAEAVSGDSEQIRASARELAESLVPQGYTLDAYLAEMAGRWVKLLNNKARQNLLEDVNSLIRDNLRGALRLRQYGRITGAVVESLAVKIIHRTPSLQQLSGKEALHIYIQLYILKLLARI